MSRNSFALAFAYFQHWLRKEDLYSQQSPFIFSRYQDLIAYLKSAKHFHLKAVDFSASIFSNTARKRTTSAENFNSAVNPITRTVWKPRKKAAFREWIDALVFAVIAASLIRWLLLEPFTIPTASMEKTLLVGDFLFVSKSAGQMD